VAGRGRVVLKDGAGAFPERREITNICPEGEKVFQQDFSFFYLLFLIRRHLAGNS
jgi:hypothetical protein